MSPRSFISSATAIVAVIGLVACGGDSAKDEEPAVKRAVEQAVTTKDAKRKCEELSTESFVKRVYGDLAQCRRAESQTDDPPPTGATVSAVEVEGDSATVKVRLEGSDTDGASGTLELRKESGDWRIDDLGVDFLRSQVTTGLSSDQSTPALSDPKVRECTREAFLRLSDSELRRVAYMAIADTDEGTEEIGKLLTPCLTAASGGSDSVSTLRKLFESGVAQKARSEGIASPSAIACVNKGLRSTISDEEISKLAFNGSKPTPAMQRAIVQAFGRCQDRPGAQRATVLRKLFERGVRAGAAKRNIPKRAVDCVIRKLRSSITDEEIIAATTDAAKKQQLSRRTARELIDCDAIPR